MGGTLGRIHGAVWGLVALLTAAMGAGAGYQVWHGRQSALADSHVSGDDTEAR
jgi:hypothetical protein